MTQATFTIIDVCCVCVCKLACLLVTHRRGPRYRYLGDISQSNYRGKKYVFKSLHVTVAIKAAV